MNKRIIGAVLFICMLSFLVVPSMAAQDTTPGDRVITPTQMAANKLQELNEMKVFEQRATHSKADFTNVVPGVGGLKYKAEQMPPGFEHVPETVTMVSWQDEGQLHIRDTEHRTATIQVPWSTLQEVEGFDGEHVRVWHYDDSGTCDGKWVQTVSNEGGYAYLEDVPFSEVIVGGFTGTYSKVDTEIDITDTINQGRTFDSDDVSSVTLNIEDQYADKIGPYDINTTGLIGWWKCDEGTSTLIEDSINGNNGTLTGNYNWIDGKYNYGINFTDSTGYVDCGDNQSINFSTQGITVLGWYATNTSSFNDGAIVKKYNAAPGDRGFVLESNFDLIRWIVSPDGDATVRVDVTNGDIESALGAEYDITDINFYAATCDLSTMEVYVNSVFIESNEYPYTTIQNPVENIILGRDINSVSSNVKTLDEIMVFDRPLSEEEIQQIYYISASSLQTKTNSNATYSDYWNSSADNPLSVPYGASESISSISFAQPESIEQNGVTIYNPINVLFNATATIGYTEDTYLIEEFCDEGFYVDQYAVEISHTPSADNANGQVSYNPTDSLCSDIMSKSWDYELESNNPAATITTFNANSLIIDTGAITAGTEYSYTVIAEADHTYADGKTANQKAASIWGTGVSILNVAFTISILAAGIVALKNATDPEKSAKPAIEALVGLSIGMLVLTLIATLGTGLGSAIETLLGV